MGKRGPLPKRKILGAAYLAAQAEAAAERGQIDAAKLLTMPDGLSAAAQQRWLTLAPLLLEDGRLRADTRQALVITCRLEAQEAELSAQLEDQGPMLSGPHGQYANPLHRVVQGIRSQLMKYQGALGLDPAGRARLKSAGHLEPQQAKSDRDREIDEILYGPGGAP